MRFKGEAGIFSKAQSALERLKPKQDPLRDHGTRWRRIEGATANAKQWFVHREISAILDVDYSSANGGEKHAHMYFDIDPQSLIVPPNSDFGVIYDFEKEDFQRYLKDNQNLAIRLSLTSSGSKSIREGTITLGVEEKDIPDHEKGSFESRDSQAVMVRVLANERGYGHITKVVKNLSGEDLPFFLKHLAREENPLILAKHLTRLGLKLNKEKIYLS